MKKPFKRTLRNTDISKRSSFLEKGWHLCPWFNCICFVFACSVNACIKLGVHMYQREHSYEHMWSLGEPRGLSLGNREACEHIGCYCSFCTKTQERYMCVERGKFRIWHIFINVKNLFIGIFYFQVQFKGQCSST